MGKVGVLHIITNLALGGAQKNALYTAANLDSCKYEKYFISAPWGGLYDQLNQDKAINFYFLKCLKRSISPLKDIQAFFSIIRFIKQNKISIVHTHSSKAGILGRWAAKFAKVPIIIHTVHGWSFHEYMSKPIKALYVFLERWTAGITTKFIAVSENDIKKGLNNKIGKAKQYELIRYGIEINRFEQIPAQHNSQAVLTVGMIACLKPQKNPIDFIRAAEIIAKTNKNVRFICIGGGKLRKNLEKEIMLRSLNKQVKLLGWRKDISQLIRQMDIVVLTSLWEGLPIALLEAMAAAKPIVAYDTDGIREAVKNGISGFLCPKKDIHALAEAIKKLLDEPALTKSMGQKAYELISDSDFNAEDMIQNIEGLYKGLLNNRK